MPCNSAANFGVCEDGVDRVSWEAPDDLGFTCRAKVRDGSESAT